MGKKILIADDSTLARAFLKQCCTVAGLSGASFLEAKDGEEALGVIERTQDIDLLILDVNMPKKDGITVLLDSKSKGSSIAQRTVVVTSTKNPAKEEMLKQLGVIAVLEKPLSPARLAAAIVAMK